MITEILAIAFASFIGGNVILFSYLFASKALDRRKQIKWRKAEFRRMARYAFTLTQTPDKGAMGWAKTYAKELATLEL